MIWKKDESTSLQDVSCHAGIILVPAACLCATWESIMAMENHPVFRLFFDYPLEICYIAIENGDL